MIYKKKNNKKFEYRGARPKGLHVIVFNDDKFGAIRKFKKKVQDEGIIQDVKNRQEYIKPSEKRRKAKAAGRARYMKKMEKRFEELGY